MVYTATRLTRLPQSLVARVSQWPPRRQELLQDGALGLALAIDAPSLEAAMAIENRNQTLCARTNDFAEGRRAFLEKRAAVYTNS